MTIRVVAPAIGLYVDRNLGCADDFLLRGVGAGDRNGFGGADQQ